MRKGTPTNWNATTGIATIVAILTACAVVLSSGPRTGDDLVEQTEDNQNSQSVITLPEGGPVTVF